MTPPVGPPWPPITATVALQLAPRLLAVETLRLAGLVAAAAGLSALAAVGYRWYAGDRIQEGLAALVGLAAVAVYLNTTTAIGQVIGGGAGLFQPATALANLATFLLAAAATLVGRRVGDWFAVEVLVLTGRDEFPAEVVSLASAVGRVDAVTLPEVVHDIEGYDPANPETKAALAGRTLLFPRGLSRATLHDRLRDRLVDDYGVGHVDVDLGEDGTVEYLGLGRRAAGLSPTLVPGTAAVAVRADPAFAAASGDAVELWRTTPALDRVALGELRGATDDVVTIALPEDAAKVLPEESGYRLVTRPAGPHADREFAGVLRAADETMAAVTVEAGSRLVGTPVGDVDPLVVAIQPSDGSLLAVPARARPFEPGDVGYAVGRPEALRELTAGARGRDDWKPSS